LNRAKKILNVIWIPFSHSLSYCPSVGIGVRLSFALKISSCGMTGEQVIFKCGEEETIA
jgi:hypothetical protein